MKSEKEAKKLVPLRFYKWIHIFRRKVSEKMLMRKVWDHVIELKEEFVLRKRKVYPLSKKKREEVYKFIEEQLKKKYMLLFVCLAYVLLHALFLFDITFFPSRLISLHKIRLYISLHHTVLTSVLCYKD